MQIFDVPVGDPLFVGVVQVMVWLGLAMSPFLAIAMVRSARSNWAKLHVVQKQFWSIVIGGGLSLWGFFSLAVWIDSL